jgi:hypothetical protein
MPQTYSSRTRVKRMAATLDLLGAGCSVEVVNRAGDPLAAPPARVLVMDRDFRILVAGDGIEESQNIFLEFLLREVPSRTVAIKTGVPHSVRIVDASGEPVIFGLEVAVEGDDAAKPSFAVVASDLAVEGEELILTRIGVIQHV